ncbi:MAG: hypothetical protein AAFX08_00855 [Pseudomonadota bacterium]
MAEQYDFIWHGPIKIIDHDGGPHKKLAELLARPDLRAARGVYLIVGQQGVRRWSRRPIYIGATMRTFEDRLIEHLGGTSRKGKLPTDDVPTDAKILCAEKEGWTITSVWLGEVRSTLKDNVHHLRFAERTLIYFFDPLLNKKMNRAPAQECTIINRINKKLWHRTDPFEWYPNQLPTILDVRRDSKERISAEAYWQNGRRGGTLRRRYLVQKGALWRKKYLKSMPSADFDKPPLIG